MFKGIYSYPGWKFYIDIFMYSKVGREINLYKIEWVFFPTELSTKSHKHSQQTITTLSMETK